MTPPAHRVTALCPDGVVAFDLSIAAQIFTLAHRSDGTPLYDFSTCSPQGAEVRTTTGFTISPGADLAALEEADTAIVPGYFAIHDSPPPVALEALRTAASRGVRMISVCTGAFALAYAGLLDGRRATTHWSSAELLAKRFPAIDVDPAALYVDEGRILTSAGLSAGIDLCLHVVRSDYGAAAGDRVARHMVAAPHRDGGQAQFIKRPIAPPVGSLEATRRWALDRLGEPLDIAAMARHAAVSPRTFARRFREEVGTTPLQWLLAQRVLEARRLLEETDLPVEDVAWRCGFGTATSLREHFRRATATTPLAYRRSFRLPEPSAVTAS